MIVLTRLSGSSFVLNCDLIERIDSTPDTVVTVVDHKPKRHQDLKRLRNIHTNPAVSLLVDHYDEDWRQLWWVRADGRARIVPGEATAERADPVRRLVAKYPQYADRHPRGPVIVIEVTRWSGWAFAEEQFAEEQADR